MSIRDERVFASADAADDAADAADDAADAADDATDASQCRG